MALSKRLLALYEMVEKGSIAADIGCDHAQLSVALVQNHICPHVYACDLREQPLKRAKQAIQEAHLSDRITACLQNGIEHLAAEVNTIIIAGMGVETALMILSAEPQELQEHRTFIIQVNNHVDKLRTWISDHHFTIEKEALVEEEHFYQIVCFSCRYHEAYSKKEQLFGVYLPQEPLFQRYLRHCLHKLDHILDHLPPDHIRAYELQQRKNAILEQLNDSTEIKNEIQESKCA